jgi:hypothetical protein
LYDHDGDSPHSRRQKLPPHGDQSSRCDTGPATKAPAANSAAAAKTADTNMEIFMEKVRADKKLLVAANMGLSDAEGKDSGRSMTCIRPT